jgi:hypothetical protein
MFPKRNFENALKKLSFSPKDSLCGAFFNINMLSHHALLFLVTLVISAVIAVDIPNCSISAAALTAQNNTCIDLSLCPVPGTIQICPMIYFPVCGKMFPTYQVTTSMQ